MHYIERFVLRLSFLSCKNRSCLLGLNDTSKPYFHGCRTCARRKCLAVAELLRDSQESLSMTSPSRQPPFRCLLPEMP
jgi:hypothetical protein